MCVFFVLFMNEIEALVLFMGNILYHRQMFPMSYQENVIKTLKTSLSKLAFRG